jgi:hypothetical protein
MSEEKKARGKVDVARALDLKLNHNMSYKDIAKLQGVWPNAIFKRLQPLLPDETAQVYRDHRADVLSHMQVTLLSQVDSRRLKKVSTRDAIISMGILYDKERLERGLATFITDPGALTVELQEISARKEALIQVLKSLAPKAQSQLGTPQSQVESTIDVTPSK